MHVLHLIFTAILSSSSNILAFEPFSLPLCNISLILPYTPSDPDPKNLLPTALRPFHYDLKLEPHLPPGNFSFNGHVKINLRCDENTKNITLNAWNITIFEETIRVKKMSDGTTVEHIRLTYNNTQQRVVIHLRRELEALQDYSVSMAYLGLLNNKQMGFYRSSYKDKQKKVRWLATTHFEPTGARLAFPCFDEPNYKATFAITIVRPTNMISLSNMPIAQTISRENSAEDIYDIGVPMSTYLAAFIICDFTFKYSKASKTLFRVWSRQSEADKIEYALEVGPKILDFFEEYFSIAFPLPKQDMIGIPDFIAGAMENWGLVTYKENSFFYHPDLFTILRKWRVFSVVAHELAHQWFGNLVTLKWWNDLWLNEGFATYLMYIACDYVDPTFEMLDGLISERMHDVLELDSTVQSHPVSVIVNHPDEITSIFDTISYGKGAAIIRMMNHFMGERALRKGLTIIVAVASAKHQNYNSSIGIAVVIAGITTIMTKRNYLTKLSFKNAIQDDLWYYLSEQSHVDVKLIMDSWTRQSGYPVVEVKRNYDNHSCTITQKRFRIDKVDEQLEAFAPSDNGNLWHIPLSFTTSAEKDFSNTLPKFWMSNNTDKMVIGKEKDVPTSNQSWILFNIKHTVLCRINYDTHNWNLLFNQLLKDHKVIHSINRAQIIFDALNLARANELGYRTAFNLTLYLINEREYLPWKATEKCLAFLNVMLRNTSDYQAYKKYIRKILTPIYEDLGFDEGVEDTPTIKITRMMILNWACGVDHEGCLQKTSELYRLWKSDPVKHPLAPNLKEIVLKYGIKEGTVLYWNFTLLKYQESDVDEEKRILLSALASSKNRKILRRFLKTAVDPKGGIHKHHLQYVFDDLLNTVEGHTTLLDFLRDNWQTVKEILSTAKFKKLVQKLIRFANTEEGIQQLRSISSALTPRKEDMSYSDSNANVRWMQRNFNDGLRVPRIMSPTNLKQNHQVLFWLGALVSINVFSLGSMDICNLPVSDTQLILPDLQPAPNLRYFLPKTVRPTRYILELQPFLPPAGNISFSGLINIDVRCEETTHRITLNLVDIAVDLSSVIVRDITEKRRIEIKSFKEDYEAQQFVIDLAEELSPYDDYTISMKYSGSFSDSIAGLYASPYLDHNGNTKWAIITKFVPTGARRVFPCFDEPDYQAVFVVTMIRSSHLISISNSPIHHTEDRENNVTADTFHPTLPMSTYQLGFAVCDLTFQSRHSLFTLFRVWSRPEIRKQVEYVLDVAPQALEFFEDYLDIRFPLPKLDVITLPFLNEMQTSWNWGMITTRESALVFEPKISSAKHKEDVLGFIFHEIAHQWFGNLVTPAWWNDLWFIEGFATYLQFAGLDNKEPFWDAMNTMFVNKLLFAALDRDAYSGTRPLSHMMNHPAEIENIFNIISFQKGACIIRMMEHFLGEPTFHSGLRAAADNQKQIDVKKLMDSWIHQAGYPVVTVNRNYSSMTAVLFQNRFLIHGTNITSYPEVWFIPVTFTTSVEKDFYNTTPAFWMSASSEFRYLSSRNGVPERNVWMIFNIKATTYCRFNYDTQNWNLLIEQLLADHKVIHHINRAQLIDDSFNLARSKEVSYEIPLKLTTYLSKEMDFLPWQSAFRNFEFIDKMLTNTTANEYLKAYMCKLLSPVFDRIGIEVKQTDSHSQRLLRADVLNWACLMGHHGCLKKAAYLFEIWMDPWSMYSQISPDLKKPVLCSTIRHGGEFQWNLVYDRLLSSKVEKERIEFIRALGCSADPASLERFLNKAVDSDIQEREFKEFFNSLLSTSIGWRIAFDFLCSNSTHLLTRYGSNRSQQIRLLIKSVALSAVNEHQYTELEAVASQFMTQVEHGVITANMKWFESNYYYVTSFLKQQILGKES